MHGLIIPHCILETIQPYTNPALHHVTPTQLWPAKYQRPPPFGILATMADATGCSHCEQREYEVGSYATPRLLLSNPLGHCVRSLLA